jgi:hypothetical protein
MQAHHVMKLLPEPFGLDRQRLRLKAGASEKVKLSFLPFVMPANPPPAASTTRPRKAGKAATQQAQDATQAAAFVRCLLVLRDSECGEFTYELLGEVGQPGVFLQHEAKIWVDGQQVRMTGGRVFSDSPVSQPGIHDRT